MANIYEPAWDAEIDRNPYRWKRAFVGRQTGCEKIGASLFEVMPGASTFPFHAHHNNEELIIVLTGRLSLRTPESERVLGPGETVACLTGLRGAHRLDNPFDEPARVLVVSTMLAPEINEFPDSQLLWARTYAPGTKPGDDAIELQKQSRRPRPTDAPLTGRHTEPEAGVKPGTDQMA